MKFNSDSKNRAKIHLIFDFGEKILLPSILKKLGQLPFCNNTGAKDRYTFVTGLKQYFFGVHRSNLRKKFMYSLPEVY